MIEIALFDPDLFTEQSPAEVGLYEAIIALSEDDFGALERFSKIPPSASVEEKRQLVQRMAEEHPGILKVILAVRPLAESLHPDAGVFLASLVSWHRE